MVRSLDVRVDIKHFSYSKDNQWPPLESVLDTAFWKADIYSELRDRLRRGAPETSVTIGGQFVTVNCHKDKDKAPSVEPEDVSQDIIPASPATQVCLQSLLPATTCMKRHTVFWK